MGDHYRTVSTLAWYQVGNASAKQVAESATVTVDTPSFQSGNVYFTPTIKLGDESPADIDIPITDRSGSIYYYTGEVKNKATTSQVAMSARRRAITVELTLNTTNVSDLAAVAGDYYLTIKATGNAKISLTDTTAEHADTNSNKQYDSGDEADGVLGQAVAGEVSLFKVVIAADGGVQWQKDGESFTGSGTTWTTPTSAVTSNTLYVGLEVDADKINVSEASVTISGTIAAKMYKGTAKVPGNLLAEHTI